MFKFKLKHVKGATFAPDGLSRREVQPGGEDGRADDDEIKEYEPLEDHPDWDYSVRLPEDFNDFKEAIDERGGYFQSIGNGPASIEDFGKELEMAKSEEQVKVGMVSGADEAGGLSVPQ